MDKKEQVKKVICDNCILKDCEVCDECALDFDGIYTAFCASPLKPEMVVCPKPDNCPDKTCPHRIAHEIMSNSCENGGNCKQICIPVSPPEPVKPEEGLLLTDEEMSQATINSYNPNWDESQLFAAGIRAVALAQLAKLQPELDRREARIKTLEGEVKAQHETLIKYSSKWESALAQAKAEERKAIGEWLEGQQVLPLKEHESAGIDHKMRHDYAIRDEDIAKLQKGESPDTKVNSKYWEGSKYERLRLL
jgi:hypothetical protein